MDSTLQKTIAAAREGRWDIVAIAILMALTITAIISTIVLVVFVAWPLVNLYLFGLVTQATNEEQTNTVKPLLLLILSCFSCLFMGITWIALARVVFDQFVEVGRATIDRFHSYSPRKTYFN